jgi:EAL domain-containing protein (putative c-di-GMP-specific phosphodiesterase class I)
MSQRGRSAVEVALAGLARMRRTMQDAQTSNALLHAIRRGEIVVYYQPIIDMVEGRIVGVEALARWLRPDGTMVQPDAFIPAAERTGAVVELDREVLRLAAHEVAGASVAHGQVGLSVNVSAARIVQPDLLDDVRTVLADSGLDPRMLHLEITETSLIQDIDTAAANIRALRTLGVKVAIDDFGVGQTSMGYIDDFTVDVVKIDRSFVSKAKDCPRTASLVGGLINLFEGMGLEVVGEGVSCAEEYSLMASLGCKLAQGFYIGHPTPWSDVEPRLRAAAV